MKYTLIQKWLGLQAIAGITSNGVPTKYTVDADELEAKLAEGFAVYRNELNYVSLDKDWQVALAIGKQPIKKKTREEAALELLQEISQMSPITAANEHYANKAKAILEMKK